MNKLISKYRNLSKPVKASFWFMVAGFLQRGISVITTPIFTRLLTTEQYGTYSVFNSWLEVLTVIVTLKLAAGVYSQGLVKYSEDENVFSSSLLGLATTSTIIWFIIYLLFHNTINSLLEMSSILMIAMFIMMWSTISFNFWSTSQRVKYEYKKLIILTIAVSIAKPILGIVCVLCTPVYKAEARILSLAVVELLAYSGLFIYMIKKGGQFYNKKYWKYGLKFNIPLIPHYLSKNILNHSDRIMIKMLTDASNAGLYSLAYNISSLSLIFNTSISSSMTPWMYQKMKKGNIKDMAHVVYLLFVLVAVINLMIIAIAPEAVAVFAPSSYSEAIWVIPPVTMSVLFQFMYSLFSNFEFYYEKTKWIMYGSLVGAVLNVALNFIFIKQFGYIAAAYTTLVCYMVFAFMHYFMMRKVCNTYCNGVQPFDSKVIISISLAFVLSGFLLTLLFNYWYFRYALVLIGLIVAYFKRDYLKSVLSVVLKKKIKS